SGLYARGTGNICIGYNAGPSSYSTLSNRLYIDNWSGTSSTSFIYGVMAPVESRTLRINADVGIGTNPYNKLYVYDNVAGHAAKFVNDGNLNNRSGIVIQAGTDNYSGDIVYVDCLDGNGTWLGSLFARNGAMMIAGKSASIKTATVEPTKSNALELLHKIKVVDYKNFDNNNTLTGFVGEELYKAYPDAVFYNEQEDTYAVSYEQLVPLLLKAIQEQQAIIDKQQVKINEISNDKTELQTLKAEIEAIKAMLK
ncbi:MAG TPA: hypothetical protein PLV65_11945, partial [Tenuifilaceae bacterium]|nr:hypothetical protein [Tenuifilaceae bacterium]